MQEYVQRLYNVEIGSDVTINRDVSHVVGKFHERYVPEAGTPSDVYVLALNDRKELGLEQRGGEWHIWFSRFMEMYPKDLLEKKVGTLRNVERGSTDRIHSMGDGTEYRPEYVFGEENGEDIFLAIGEDSFDRWVSRPVSMSSIVLP